MNCRRTKNLIPLYVEDDLEPKQHESVSLHLYACGECRRLEAEYRQSQDWLRGQVLPVFDKAELDALKATVLSQIERDASRHSFFRSLSAQWNHWHRLTAAALVIIVCFAAALYFYAGRSEKILIPPVEVATDLPSQKDLPGLLPEGKGVKLAPGAISKAQLNIVRAKVKRKSHPRPASEQMLASNAHKRRELNTNQAQAEKSSQKDMLRIEIQTADPNIRIIWFAPKESDSQQSRPVTD